MALGSVIFWRLSGNMPASGLPEIEAPRGMVALRRALEGLYPNDRVEPCRSSTERALVVMRREDTGGKVAYREVDRVWFELGKPTKFQAEYDTACDTLIATDVMTYITAFAGKLGALPLRDRGGVYFLPESAVASWRELGARLRGCSAHQLYDITANSGPESVRAVLDSLMHEVRARIEETRAEDIGRRGVKNRLDALDSWREEVRAFESTLGMSLVDLRREIDDFGAELGMKLVLAC